MPQSRVGQKHEIQKRPVFYYGQIVLIAAEISLISFLAYAVKNFLPVEMARYISLDVLYCLPIIQTARLAALHATRLSYTQTATLIGITVALALSATETAISWPNYPMNAFALNTFTRSVVFTLIGRVVIKLWRERKYARKDMLTGLANRLELMERLETELGRSERSGRPCSVLFIDIDRFKAPNDIYGHGIGDDALKILADILRESSREADVVARYGGDEFVLLLPDTDERYCDNLIKWIEASSQQVFERWLWPISLSFGRTTETGRKHKADWVLRLANEDMYEAKRMKQKRMVGTSAPVIAVQQADAGLGV